MTTQAIVLKAEPRNDTGTRATKRVRRQSKVPAIIYGHGETPQAVQLDYHDLALELQHHHRLVTVDLGGKQQQCLVKEVQYDHLQIKILHVDLTRVSMDERVEVSVTLEFKGTPAGAEEGGLLDHVLGDIEVECPVASIPENIRVNVSQLGVGDVLKAGDIVLPAGIKLLTDPETVVAIVTVPAEEEVEEAAPAEGAEEPEVIKREEAEEAAGE